MSGAPTVQTTSYSSPPGGTVVVPTMVTYGNLSGGLIAFGVIVLLWLIAITVVAALAFVRAEQARDDAHSLRDQVEVLQSDVGLLQNVAFREWTHSVPQPITTGTDQLVQFDTTVGTFNDVPPLTLTNTRLTPTRAGWYRVAYQVAFAANAVGYRTAYIRKNGNANSRYGFAQQAAAPVVDTVLSESAEVFFDGTTDFVEVLAGQNSGVTLNLNPSLASANRFVVTFLRP